MSISVVAGVEGLAVFWMPVLAGTGLGLLVQGTYLVWIDRFGFVGCWKLTGEVSPYPLLLFLSIRRANSVASSMLI